MTLSSSTCPEVVPRGRLRSRLDLGHDVGWLRCPGGSKDPQGGGPRGRGSTPLAAQSGFGSVWVTNSADGTVTRLDPEDNSVLATIPVGAMPFQLAAAGGGMWVATQNAAVKIDPGTDRVALRVPYPGDAKIPSTGRVGLDADERAVWVSTAVGTVLRLRPDNGRLVATIRVLPDKVTSPGSVAIDGDHVWVSSWARTVPSTRGRPTQVGHNRRCGGHRRIDQSDRPSSPQRGLPSQRDATPPGQPVYGRRLRSEPRERPDPRGLAVPSADLRATGGWELLRCGRRQRVPVDSELGRNTHCTCYPTWTGRPADPRLQSPGLPRLLDR